jgi:carboxymethylenebutenolidase
MCYDSKAQPPFPMQRRGGAQGKDLVVSAPDGNHFAAFAARAEQPFGAQVVILPDVRGLHRFYRDLALLFAEAGVHALAWDYFGRTAADQPRDDSFEFWPHVQQMQPQTFTTDLGAAIAAARREFGNLPLFTLGFCMGGSLSLKAATGDYGLSGALAFYSGLSRAFGAVQPSVLEFCQAITVPILDLFGGADQGIPPEDVATFKEKLTAAQVEHEVVVYPGAPHSFFDRRWTDYADASADAWTRMLGFLTKHAGQATQR